MKKIAKLLPIIILSVYLAFTIIGGLRGFVYLNGEPVEVLLNWKHWLSLTLLVINYIAWFKFRKFFKYSLSVTLLLGLTGVILFSYDNLKTFYTFNSFEFEVFPRVIFAALVSVIVYFKDFKRLLSNLRTEAELDRKKTELKTLNSETDQFRFKFEKYSDQKLLQIAEDESYSEAARYAAKSLIAERSV
ncbi:MAG: hypothetical protein GC181_10365 [Bacteroidetes bacterium]|nr:hypothetical protein [Bacteroidota bacterium]